MKNKKAMQVQFSQTLTILLAVAILSIVVIALYPKIKNLPHDGLAALGLVDDKCAHSGLTAEDYSEKITIALYNEHESSAISYFREFKDKCDFDVDDLTIGGGQGREKSILLADTLCQRGDFIDARDIYKAIPGDDKGDMAETCTKLAEIKVLLARGKLEDAKEIAEEIAINTDSPNEWKAAIAEVYMELEDYSPAYDIYYAIYQSYEEQSNPLTGILSTARILTKLSLLNNLVLIKTFENSESNFCFNIPEYYFTTSSSMLMDYAENEFEITLSITSLENVKDQTGFSCSKSQDSWTCSSIDSCTNEIIDLAN
ncbi:MAG: tetratricopeptide repeat protein [Nanoarchaeota archaeon]|nr:tetratricopeptide repeat protein [Nanoarchaeota archaeon]